MNSFIMFAAVFAAATTALPLSPVSVSQDTLGNYKLQYQLADSSRIETAHQGNELTGTYTFEDKEGDHHQIKYTAGQAGFQATGDVIPVAPRLTPEVAHATAEHLAIYRETARKLPVLREEELEYEYEVKPDYYVVPAVSSEEEYHHHHHVLPAQEVEYVVIVNGVPQDTEEVLLAKRQLLEAHKEAIARLVQ